MFGQDEANKLRFTFYPAKVDYINNPDSIDIGIIIDLEKTCDENDGRSTLDMYAKWQYKNVLYDIDALNIVEVYQNNTY